MATDTFTNDSYKVVFDIANDNYYKGAADIPSMLVLALFCIALSGAMSAIFLKCFPKWAKKHIFLSGIFFSLFLTVACVVSFHLAKITPLVIGEMNEHPENIRNVEGIVTNLTERPKLETFCVREVCFSYNDYLVTGGFNRTQKEGGPIKNGLHVRVQYFDPKNTILRLEIASP